MLLNYGKFQQHKLLVELFKQGDTSEMVGR